jgi:hypothetical protein
MFSFLNKGDINNTIRAITNLPGLFTSDGDKIKYAALNYATVMRHNLHDGVPIFTHIRQLEAEIERHDINSIMSGSLPSAAAQYASTKPTSPFTDNDIRRDNATLALIMAKELAFLNRTIQMISLIARRYQEEQEDLETAHHPESGDLEEGGISGGEETPESETEFFGDDGVSSRVFPLERSCSSPTFDDTHSNESRRHRYRPTENQLVATFLVASGNLYCRFNNLCRLIDVSDISANAMTTQDRPHSAENREKQLFAERLVISNIFMNFSKFDTEHRDPVVWAFLELRDISVTCWKILSMFAFSNLFRLTEGTDFATMYRPEDAIFTQGRDYNLTIPRYEQEAADADVPATPMAAQDDEVPSSAGGAGGDGGDGGGGYTFAELTELVAKRDAESAAAACEEDGTLYE